MSSSSSRAVTLAFTAAQRPRRTRPYSILFKSTPSPDSCAVRLLRPQINPGGRRCPGFIYCIPRNLNEGKMFRYSSPLNDGANGCPALILATYDSISQKDERKCKKYKHPVTSSLPSLFLAIVNLFSMEYLTRFVNK